MSSNQLSDQRLHSPDGDAVPQHHGNRHIDRHRLNAGNGHLVADARRKGHADSSGVFNHAELLTGKKKNIAWQRRSPNRINVTAPTSAAPGLNQISKATSQKKIRPRLFGGARVFIQHGLNFCAPFQRHVIDCAQTLFDKVMIDFRHHDHLP